MLDKVDLAATADALASHWIPETVAAYNGDHVQVVKVQGDYVWHHHDRTDDLFIVLRGEIRIEMRDRSVDLAAGELFVVPAGVEHRVCAEQEALTCIIEHLGDIPVDDPLGMTLGAPSSAR